MRVINRTELPIAIEGGGVDFRMDRTGDGHSVAWVRLPAGADLRPGLAGLSDDFCPCPHWGYMISGRLVMHSKDGEQTHQAGEAFYWASGHAPEALEDCEYVDFSPGEELEAVVRHLQSSGSA
jgi:hypothetical protein